MLLGRISCLIREETPLGREVRAWRRARLADESGENLVIPRDGDEPYFEIPVPATVAFVDSQQDLELAESALAAD